MRRTLVFTAAIASMALASSAFAQEADHADHHPPAAASPAKPDAVATQEEPSMHCMEMMKKQMCAMPAGKGKMAKEKPKMTKAHCAEMMARMHPPAGDKPPAEHEHGS